MLNWGWIVRKDLVIRANWAHGSWPPPGNLVLTAKWTITVFQVFRECGSSFQSCTVRRSYAKKWSVLERHRAMQYLCTVPIMVESAGFMTHGSMSAKTGVVGSQDRSSESQARAKTALSISDVE